MASRSSREESSPAAAASDAPASRSEVNAAAPMSTSYDNNDESTRMDKFAHTRGKRKRTSREDFAILESEYQRNPRPDKTTRTSIVERVSLTEKEVQIWFQNRRQMTRRKCRTWQPNEITSIIRSSQENNEDDPTDDSFQATDSFRLDQSFASEVSYIRGGQPSPSPSQEDLKEPSSLQHTSRYVSSSTSEHPRADLDDIASSQHSTGRVSDVSAGSVNMLSSSFIDPGSDQDAPAPPSESQINLQCLRTGANPRREGLKRKASAARLSTSVDGKAEIVLGNNSPSPFKKHSNPIERSRRTGQLQRSQSAVNPSADVNYQLGVDIPEWRKAKPHGRSRDVRAWEFYCDSDARNALARTAEFDKNGSAQGVLGLIRSNSSNRKPLNPLGRENLPLQRLDEAQGKTAGRRVVRSSKLQRAMSSMARLQSPKLSKPRKDGKPDKPAGVWQENFGDSDKENQDPDQPTPPPHALRVSRQNSPSSLVSQKQERGISDGGFGNEKKPKEARANLELDAVQQLLSLSQGAWQ